jgi:alkanesulfonate monooxygenase SsuD/methylene tetrahydromethanopterin reductase-like flavin-dependent oxidoreductase (luciferase family)
MSFQVGVQLHPQATTYVEIRDAWRRAEAAGVDSIWTWDHFFPLYGDPAAPHFEGWTLLTAMAADTGGRMYLGIGAGWFERDYAEYGYEFGTAPDRLRQLGQDLPRIKDRLAKLNPAPIGPLPILVGGSGEKVTLKLTAQHADAWNSFGPPETFAHKNAVLDRWCVEVGRDPAEIERTVAIDPGAVDRADEFVEAGATHLIVMVGNPYDLDAVERLIARR